MRRTTSLWWGALLVVSGGCGDGPTPTGAKPADAGVDPGWVDHLDAVRAVKRPRLFLGELASGDPNRVLTYVDGGSLVICSASLERSSALESPSLPLAPVDPGSASCDARGCVFARYLRTQPIGARDIFDGTITVTSVDGGGSRVSWDLTREGLDSVGRGPAHLTADWTLTDTRLDGSLHNVVEIPDHDESWIRFGGVTFSDVEPTGGSVYAKWVSDDYGACEVTVSFP